MSAKASASAAVAAAAATSGATAAGERVVGSVGAVVGGLMAVAVTVF